MAVLNTVTSLVTPITLDGIWKTATITDTGHSGYFLAKWKTAASGSENVDKAKVCKIKVELGIDTGVDGDILSAGFIELDFDEITSNSAMLNESTALKKFTGLESNFYYRAYEIETRATTIDDHAVIYKIGDTINSTNITTDIALSLLPLAFN